MNRSDDRIHERARLLAADAVDAELGPKDAEWLAAHLESCPECREAADDFAAIRAELRAMPAPVPPRDLWARTAAGLDAVDRRRARGFLGLPRIAFGSSSMVGSAIAVGVVVVLVGVSVLTQPAGPLHPNGGGSPARSGGGGIAVATHSAEPGESFVAFAGDRSAIVVDQNTNTLLYRAVVCTAGETCTVSSSGGSEIATGADTGPITSVTVDAGAQQAAVSTKRAVKVVPVTTASPSAPASPSATVAITMPPQSPTPSAGAPTPSTPATPATPSAPAQSPTASATPVSTPVTILDGYQTVGEPEFSPDGTWLAFAARPADGSAGPAGPDVFVWHTGDASARPITSSHAAIFSGWSNGRILLSQVLSRAALPDKPSPSPSTSATPAGSGSASASPRTSAAASPGGSSSPSPALPSYVAVSYLVDPADCSGDRLDLESVRPVIDPTGTRIVYWSGAVSIDPAGQPQLLGGDLYYDLWVNIPRTPVNLCGSAPAPETSPSSQPSATATSQPSGPKPSPSGSQTPSVEPGASASPAASPSTSPGTSPGASPSEPPSPVLPALPQRIPVADAAGLQSDWAARWDPSGQRLGVWVADDAVSDRGQLSVFGVDLSSDRVFVDTALLTTLARPGFQMTASGAIFTSPPAVGDGKIHVWPWPATPIATPTATAAASGPDGSQQPGS